MSWEYTIICDSCQLLIAGGSAKSRALHDLRHTGGKAVPVERHLCSACVPQEDGES